MDLARLAVGHVRQWGGVLEHPAGSKLWADQGLPRPGQTDDCGGWTLPILQQWFGHRAEKATWLYIVGRRPRDLPDMPFVMGAASVEVQNMGRGEREKTPIELAVWLVKIAQKSPPL